MSKPLLRQPKSGLTNRQFKKEKELESEHGRHNGNKEREVQDVGDENIMYEPLLDDIDADTFMDEDDFEIEMGVTRRDVRRRAGGSHPKR